ncbi:MAG TPA: sigma 54-interacting transcriptional regulator [Candidatus Binataceae bacterium]
MADWLRSAGLDVLPYHQKHLAPLYVDFVGARPPGVEVVSIDLGGRAPRTNGELATGHWQSAACLVVSRALQLKPPLLTADPGMLATIKSAIAVAPSPVNVLISGEIGAAKYSLARLMSAASRCHSAPLTVNCASFEDVDLASLVAAIAAPVGNSAAPGTVLYLDEVGELADSAQVKLLQLVQAFERTPLADAELRRPVVRFVAATNRPLAAMVDQGDFRRELYWRLNVFGLAVPPLRERPGDIALMARYFLHRTNPKRGFAPAALKALSSYTFPGNCLELENLVTRLAIAPLDAGASIVDLSDVRRQLMVAPQAGESKVSGWKTSREEARREMILRTITAAGGNRAEAARRLGITLRALQYHITRAGLSRRRSPRLQEIAIAPSANQPDPRGEQNL